VARDFAAQGATHLHVVDLDGAKDQAARQSALVLDIAGAAPLQVQTGGGLRDASQIEALLTAGIARVIIGSLAARDVAATRALLERLGGARIVLALDVRLDARGVARVETAGWQGGAELELDALLERYAGSPLATVLCTDIGRDGMLAGPNLA